MSAPDYFLRGRVRLGPLSSEPFALRLPATDPAQAIARANHDRTTLALLAAPGVSVDAFLTGDPDVGPLPKTQVTESWGEIGALTDPKLNDWFVGAPRTRDTSMDLSEAFAAFAHALTCLGPTNPFPAVLIATNAASVAAFSAANEGLRVAVIEAGGEGHVLPALQLERDDLQELTEPAPPSDWNSPAELAYLASALSEAAASNAHLPARRIDASTVVDTLITALRDIPQKLPEVTRPLLIEPYCTLIESFGHHAPEGYREALLWAVARFRGDVGRDPRALSSAIDLLEVELAHWRAGGTKT